MKGKKLFFLLFFSGAYLLFGCRKVDVNFGSEFVNNDITQIIKVDTFQVALSTVLLDSFATNAKGVALVGGYSDPIFGKIETQSF
ncbi:MAG: hypothetical protein ACOVQE_11430, partial [Chitinophagaceae bacterium]